MQQLVRSNAYEPALRCIHELFEEQAALRPRAAALIEGQTSLCYQELNERANQLAQHLQQYGVAQETLVAICMPPCSAQIIGLLAILKAGGAYLPLEPDYPSERLLWILQDSQAAFLLTAGGLQRLSPDQSDSELLAILHQAKAEQQPSGWQETRSAPTQNLVATASPESLAYVLYTSGSTGQPKGVMGEHRGAVNRFAWMWQRYPFMSGELCCYKTMLSFVDSVWEIFGPLLQGIPLVIIPNDVRRDPYQLVEMLMIERISRIVLVPTMLAAILEQGPDITIKLAHLRFWISSGEPLTAKLAGRFHQLLPGRTLLNLYGSTEVAGDATFYESQPGDEHTSVPIGFAISNMHAFVFNDKMQQVEPGTLGELYLGGIGLARGYLHRPELSASVFIAHPDTNAEAPRLYKTGDLVRFCGAGPLEYIGRVDRQLKIRGFRVEPAEIERHILKYPGIGAVAVIADTDSSAGEQLIACIVMGNKTQQPDASVLRMHLAQSLPDYMIPGRIIVLPELPLLPNGKIDRAALVVALPSQHTTAENMTATECIVAAIWTEVLGQDQINIHEDFLALGGHSLLAAQIIARVREHFQHTIALARMFTGMTISDMALAIDLAAGQRDKAEYGARSRNNHQALAILPAQHDRLIPASFGQQRFWLLHELGLGAAHTLVSALRMHGQLNVHALEQSFAVIERRHSILRTHFALHAGELIQIIAAPGAISLRFIDLGALPQAAQEEQLSRLIAEAVRQPFDLMQGPLFRPLLFQLAEDDALLLLLVHHSIIDGWSYDLLYRELSVCYAAALEAKLTIDATLQAPLPLSYADYAIWQRSRLDDPDIMRQRDYWKTQLADLPDLLPLPYDFPRPALPSGQGRSIYWSMPADLFQSLRLLARTEHVTLFMTMLAAWATLLTRYTAQTDIAIGLPVANRSLQQFENLPGFFVNTLVLRIDSSLNPSFRSFLQRVRTSAIAAYEHQDLPFEQIVELLRPERSLSYQPLFQVLFAYEQVDDQALNLPGVTIRKQQLDPGTAQFDLTLLVEETASDLRLRWEYATDVFATPTIERMAHNFETLLRGIIAEVDQQLDRLPIISAQERQYLEALWQSPAPASAYTSLSALVELQACQRPHMPAVSDLHEQLSYATLNQRANQLAHVLRQYGVGPDSVVGLSAERSLTSIVALLGILKAGAAYLPLDPAYPHDRLRFMAADAQLTLILVASSSQAELWLQQKTFDGLMPTPRLIVLETSWAEIAQAPTTNPTIAAYPEQLAYVLYTSGSTGQPKGVAMPQGPLVQLITWQQQQLPLAAGARVLQFASLNFDVAFQEIFSTWTAGGTLVLISEERRRDSAALLRYLDQMSIERIFLPFVALQQLAEMCSTRQHWPSSLLEVITAGEQLQITAAIRQLFSQLPACRLHNHYGPTESHVVTALSLDDSAEHWPTLPSIGRPIAQARIYLLDTNRQLVPAGVPGEIYIAGDCLAHGYYHRPDLTAARFLADLFAHSPDARMYQTGDLGRYGLDGTLSYLGRLDQQLKIRGFRVEPGEVEARLQQHVAVRAAAVVAWEDHAGNKQLIAYLVPSQSIHSSAHGSFGGQLRTDLQAWLPDYMIPAAFVILDSLPLTPSGKLDRRALPAPTAAGRDREHIFRAPITPLQQQLAQIWSAVLGLEQPGLDDHFFQLGGHSLLAAQLSMRIQEALQIELPLRAVFEAPTIASLARWIEQADQLLAPLSAYPAALSSISAMAHQYHGPLPLSFAQERLWFMHQLAPTSSAYTLALGLRLSGTLHQPALERSLDTLLQRHVALRTRFVLVEGQPVQIMDPAQNEHTTLLQVMNLHHQSATEQQAFVTQTIHALTAAPFDLAQQGLLRAYLLCLDMNEHILLLLFHHIAADGHSLGLIMRELGICYTAELHGQSASLPELPLTYADFALWQRQWLQEALLTQQASYWDKQLRGAPGLLDLPMSQPRPAEQSYRGAIYAFQIDATSLAQLRALAQQEECTLFMLLLSAFATLLYRYSNQPDILIGVPVAGRMRRELEQIVGCFVNTLVIRCDLSQKPSFRDLLQRVRQTMLEAYSNQDLPFEKLVEQLNVERSLSHHPLFQVMLTLQSAPIQDEAWPDLSVRPMTIDTGGASGDLALTLEEGSQGISAVLEYATDLFKAEDVAKLIDHWLLVLHEMVAHPEQGIDHFPLLSAAEQHVLAVWNTTTQAYPRESCIHELCTVQAHHTPDACAVRMADRQLSYRELDQRANQLAWQLQRLGAGPDRIVGLYADRSPEMVVGLLGILKAGSAYLPLDPDLPHERLLLLLEDTAATLLLTNRPQLPELPAHITVLRLNEEQEQSPEAPASAVQPDHLAYVIYTSGSTGRPKGVQIQHRSLVNLVYAMQQQFQLGPDDRLLAVTTLSFDIAALEIFMPLISGAQLIIASREAAVDGQALLQLIDSSAATILQATPITWKLLLAAGWQSSPQLTMLCGGEALSWSLATQLLQRGRTLWNMYGPTETAIWSMCGQVYASDGLITLGQPIANTSIYILDPHMQPVPIGIPGELYIGGDGLARGYQSQPSLTAERFVQSPFQPGQRLYKTGDRVRWLAAGKIEFLERLDYQIKLRGYRIEPGEIEAILTQHPHVQAALVTAHTDHAGEGQLVAYIVAAQQEAAGNLFSSLKSYLAQRLPRYMIPQAFMLLDKLPVSVNGKRDRRALPPPVRSEQPQEHALAQTAEEQHIAQIWGAVLGIDLPGIEDNFFDLGGHSLQIMQVATLLSQRYGYAIQVKDIFSYPTVRALAHILQQRTRATQHPPATKVPQPTTSPGQQPAELSIERRSLLALFAANKIEAVDAAVFGYLPTAALSHDSSAALAQARAELLQDWYSDLPGVDEVLTTQMGRIAVITLPIFEDQLYSDQPALIELMLAGLKLAAHIGASSVSLAGLLPSATSYGHTLNTAMQGRSGLPLITTGHATTSAAVALNVRRILEEADRDLSDEILGCLGLGSIGLAALRILLRVLPHPREILLCDLYSKQDSLRTIQQELLELYGFRGTIRILATNHAVPAGFYNATTIIGATNVPDVLDVQLLQPGTLIVDDSAPHCFDPQAALARSAAQHDILFTEGGVLQSPQPIHSTRYIPRAIEPLLAEPFCQELRQYQADHIAGCVLSSLLTAKCAHIMPTLGLVDGNTIAQHYMLLEELGFQGARLHCGTHEYAKPSLFRQRFGIATIADYRL